MSLEKLIDALSDMELVDLGQTLEAEPRNDFA